MCSVHISVRHQHDLVVGPADVKSLNTGARPTIDLISLLLRILSRRLFHIEILPRKGKWPGSTDLLCLAVPPRVAFHDEDLTELRIREAAIRKLPGSEDISRAFYDGSTRALRAAC